MRQIVGHSFGCINPICFDLYTLNSPKNFKKRKKKIFFWIFKIFHFWSDLYIQNYDQQFVSCLIFIFVYEKSMWHAHPLHTKGYKNGSLWLNTL